MKQAQMRLLSTKVAAAATAVISIGSHPSMALTFRTVADLPASMNLLVVPIVIKLVVGSPMLDKVLRD